MADVAGEVHAQVCATRCEIFREGLEVPLHAVEGDLCHAFDFGEEGLGVVARIFARRRDRKTTIASDHGCDAVVARRRRIRIECQLRIVVGVKVNNSGGDNMAIGIDDPRSIFCVGDVTDRGDHSIRNCDIGTPPS